MKPWVKTAAIFAVGFLLGGASTGLVIHHCFRRVGGPPPDSATILKILTSRLKLTPEQKVKVDALLKMHVPKLEALRKESHDKLKAHRDSFNSDLRAILDPEQQKKLDKMIAKWEKREEGNEWRPFGCAPPAVPVTAK